MDTTVSDVELEALRVLKHESMLQAAHPIIATNVTSGLAALLRVLGRDDLADEWLRL